MADLNLDLSAIAAGSPRRASPIYNAFSQIQSVVNGQLDKDNLAANAAILLSQTELGPYVPYTAYSPSWSASSAPSIGNGSLSGNYLKIGGFVVFRLNLAFGSTTNGGSGEWAFGLPVAATASGLSSFYSGDVQIRDDSATDYYLGLMNIASGGQSTFLVRIMTGIGADDTGIGTCSATNPFTWATTDSLNVQGWYIAG